MDATPRAAHAGSRPLPDRLGQARPLAHAIESVATRRVLTSAPPARRTGRPSPFCAHQNFLRREAEKQERLGAQAVTCELQHHVLLQRARMFWLCFSTGAGAAASAYALLGQDHSLGRLVVGAATLAGGWAGSSVALSRSRRQRDQCVPAETEDATAGHARHLAAVPDAEMGSTSPPAEQRPS